MVFRPAHFHSWVSYLRNVEYKTHPIGCIKLRFIIVRVCQLQFWEPPSETCEPKRPSRKMQYFQGLLYYLSSYWIFSNDTIEAVVWTWVPFLILKEGKLVSHCLYFLLAYIICKVSASLFKMVIYVSMQAFKSLVVSGTKCWTIKKRYLQEIGVAELCMLH